MQKSIDWISDRTTNNPLHYATTNKSASLPSIYVSECKIQDVRWRPYWISDCAQNRLGTWLCMLPQDKHWAVSSLFTESTCKIEDVWQPYILDNGLRSKLKGDLPQSSSLLPSIKLNRLCLFCIYCPGIRNSRCPPGYGYGRLSNNCKNPRFYRQNLGFLAHLRGAYT
jgi:hypothetical protein